MSNVFIFITQLYLLDDHQWRAILDSTVKIQTRGVIFPKKKKSWGRNMKVWIHFIICWLFHFCFFFICSHNYNIHEYTTTLSNVGSVDWDAEWKKVVEDRDQPKQRPGQYKSQVEIEAIKATNKVAKNVFQASQEVKSNTVQNWSSLKGDWKFWIGILVIVSFGLSILTATSVQPANESFYIWEQSTYNAQWRMYMSGVYFLGWRL